MIEAAVGIRAKAAAVPAAIQGAGIQCLKNGSPEAGRLRRVP